MTDRKLGNRISEATVGLLELWTLGYGVISYSLSRDSSAKRIFFKKKCDDATSDPETNHQVLASSLISFSWKKNIEILAQKPSLNGLSISGDQNILHQRWPKK